MILIFDLDDTLYRELDYVESGMRAVALWAQNNFGWDPIQSFEELMSLLILKGRGLIFNEWLSRNKKGQLYYVKKCISVYRTHTPHLLLYSDAEKVISFFSNYPKYIITDGNKNVQRKKILSLNISHHFKGIYITHCYGIKNAKPSTHCFNLIKSIEKCEWSDMVYVGDNPAKDFINLNPLGVQTIRVLTGGYASTIAAYPFNAQVSINNLNELPALLGSKNAK